MMIYDFDDVALAGGEIITFVKKYFGKSRVIISSSISDVDLFECDVTVKGLQTRLIELLEQFDNISGEMIVSENSGALWFDFIPDDNFKKFLGRRIKIHKEHDHRLEDFEMGGGARELYIKDKQKYLEQYSPVDGHTNLENKRKCMQCESVFLIKDYKVVAGPEIDYICCPYYPYCDGDILDWAPTEEEPHEGDLAHMYRTDRDSQDKILRSQDEYLERYYEYREIERFRINGKEGLTVYFIPHKKKMMQMVIVKMSVARKYGKSIEKIIREEQSLGLFPDDGFTPSITFIKSDNIDFLGE